MKLLNTEIAEIFEAIGNLLEIRGENQFRIIAYRRAGQILRDLSESIESVADRNELDSISGIGEDLAQKIRDYIETRQIKQYEVLRAELPEGILDLLRIPGVGPKTISLFYNELGVGSADELLVAIRNGSLIELPGIKEKTIENIRKGLEFIASSEGRNLLGDVLPLVDDLIQAVRRISNVKRVGVAGSLRRMQETIGDVDILATTKRQIERKGVIELFTELPQVAKVLAQGNTKSSVRLSNGLQVDLRVVDEGEFGSAMQYFTGSKAHNVKIRGLARKLGLKVNEYGVFKGKKKIAGKTEEEVYSALGLPWFEPELREDRGEIEAVQIGRSNRGKLPNLVKLKDIKGEIHVHTEWSDGEGTIEEVALQAKAAGCEYVAHTDHSVTERIANGLSIERMWKKIEAIDALNKKRIGIEVFKAAEVDILLDGKLDYPDDLLDALDIVVASIHSGFKQTPDKMTGRINDALNHPRVHVLAHPTGRLLNSRESYEVDLDYVMATAAENGVALEINGSYQRLDLSDVHARRALELGAIFCLSTDAHRLTAVGRFELAVATARRAWIKKSDVLNTKPLLPFKAWLAQRRD